MIGVSVLIVYAGVVYCLYSGTSKMYDDKPIKRFYSIFEL